MPGNGKSRAKTKKKTKKTKKTARTTGRSAAKRKPKTTGRQKQSTKPTRPARAKKIKEMRARLLERREGILSGMEHKLRYQATISVTKGDSSDLAAEALDSDTAMQLAESDSAELAEIDKALLNLEEGTYGRCESCGEEIPWPRLQALPCATLCVKCKEREEVAGPGGAPATGWSAVDEFADLDSD